MRVTAIIPCFNAEAFLRDAIESVLRQSRPVDEFLVVDDGSTDRSREVAAEYPVTVLHRHANAGHAVARNRGLAAASGDVIVWLDADDYFAPHHVETVCGLLELHPAAHVAFTSVRRFGAREGTFGHKSPCCGTPRNIFWECLRRTVVPAMSAATRVDALRRVGGFDPRIRVAPDFDLWLRLSLTHLFVSSAAVTVNYRWHPGQISAQPTLQTRSMYQSRTRLYERLRAEGRIVLAAQVSREIVRIWESDLRADWRRRDLQALSFHLSLANVVPGTSRLADRLERRIRLARSIRQATRRMCAWWRATPRRRPTASADDARVADHP